MTENKKPRGHFDYFLAIDCETSGMSFGTDDPSINTKTGQVYQSVSWGLIVVDATTLKTVEELYLEIKWDGESEWDKRAEKVHGLSLAHLEEHGMSTEDAVVAIAGLILKYWGPDTPLCLAGHNVMTFDMPQLSMVRSKGSASGAVMVQPMYCYQKRVIHTSKQPQIPSDPP